MEKFDFRDLFVFDLANNHQGSVEHGIRIIRDAAKVAQGNGVRAALKFQFRQLDSFIHPSHRNNSTNRHIPRFLSTRLDRKQFELLLEEVRRCGLISMCTPFDEESVDVIQHMGIELIKIASCSACDWPLIEKIAESGKPVIFSTGGLSLAQIDALVSFLDHRRVHYAIMHCVSIYPTLDHQLELSQIDLLRERYPGRVIGFSTHEDPNDTVPVQIAVAKRARIFERHIGIATDSIKLNAYSSNPEQLDQWLKAYKKARQICGMDGRRHNSSQEERDALVTLTRGVYAKRALKPSAHIDRNDVYFAMPCVEGQLTSSSWTDDIVAADGIEAGEALLSSNLTISSKAESQALYAAIHAVKAMLNESRIAVPSEFKLEISHHYGMSNFENYGAVLIDCVNRSYCKKLIIQLPGQTHPAHYHQRKEETFQILHGVLDVELDDRLKRLFPGDTLLIQTGVWHRFWTETGVVFEEISTTHFDNDSYYEDKEINRMDRSQRKTVVENWGRFQLRQETQDEHTFSTVRAATSQH